MKRKRGHKKGKSKGYPLELESESFPTVSDPNTENNSGMDEFENDEYESGMEVDTLPSTGTDQLCNVASINPDGSIDMTGGKSVGRVKVKLRTSKMLESQHTSSDAPTRSDTDKSSQQLGLEKHGLGTEKMEDSANSLPETRAVFSGNPSKKAGSIKIKPSRVFTSSVSETSNAVPSLDESPIQKDSPLNYQDSQYNKQELDAALLVIKKIMKMDAAEPFNAPVDPVALGIPDYFDVIDTPMDFGTICSHLESGVKYMNSEDVYRDVQYIWENCHKYNNKGDYIMDLMRRVKKNFMKYWTAAGLYSEHSRGYSDDVAMSNQGKVHAEGGHSKQKMRKRHGRRHKSDCLCAICVLKRRRREREENARLAKSHIGSGDNNLAQDFKQEESSLAESPFGEDSSSNMDESLDPDADTEVDLKGEDVKLEGSEQQYSPMEEKHEEMEKEDEMESQRRNVNEFPKYSQLDSSLREEPNNQSHMRVVENLGSAVPSDIQKGDILVKHGEETALIQQRRKKDLQKMLQRNIIYESLSYENPMLLRLCGVLFPNDTTSMWAGPHSLIGHNDSARCSSIHAAIEKLMK